MRTTSCQKCRSRKAEGSSNRIRTGFDIRGVCHKCACWNRIHKDIKCKSQMHGKSAQPVGNGRLWRGAAAESWWSGVLGMTYLGRTPAARLAAKRRGARTRRQPPDSVVGSSGHQQLLLCILALCHSQVRPRPTSTHVLSDLKPSAYDRCR